MANRFFSKKTLALVLALTLCLSILNISAYAAPVSGGTSKNWTYAYYLGQEYLGNAPGKAVKPDPVGYGFQGVIISLTFRDDDGKSWTFHWNSEANGEWRITGSNVSKSDATAWPQVTDGGRYIGYCGETAYEFTLSLDGKAAGWTYANDSSRHANWFYYIRFIRVYTVNVYCTLIPPVTQTYSVVHYYYTDDVYDGTAVSGEIEVEEGADFGQLVTTIDKEPIYHDTTYTYTNYQIDPTGNTIILIYVRETPEPEPTEPEVTEPEVTEPEVTEPEVTEPEVTEPEVTEPWEDIPDDDVPLVDVPKIGDPMIVYIALIVVFGVALLSIIASTKKKDNYSPLFP